jgi:5-methylcytosine-specific restriction endonuclease McrA
MIITSKENPNDTIESFPRILALTASGEALDWISYEDAATYYAKGKVLYSLGTHEVKLRGGFNAKTGEQSVLKVDTIIALANDTSPSKYRNRDPRLSNKTLFERDRNMCAYCAKVFKYKELTRDHILPSSKGGKDVWENVVTACCSCNQWKGARTPEQAEMKLVYVPYTPTHNENLILKNRNVLADQMEYLMHGVSKHSRVYRDLASSTLN